MPFVRHKIEIKANNKFRSYCRLAFGISRFAYNYGVECFTRDYEKYLEDIKHYFELLNQYKKNKAKGIQDLLPVKPKLPSALDYKKEFNKIRREKFPFTYKVTKYASQQPFIYLGRAIDVFFESSRSGKRQKAQEARKGRVFKKVFFPKFKKKSSNSGSFYIGGDLVKLCIGRSCSKKVTNDSKKQYLFIPKFGYVQLREHLRFNGHINSVTISQRGDKFFASFSVTVSDDEYKRTHKTVDHTNTAVGIDVGLKSALTLSSGVSIQSPKPLQINFRREQRLSRQLSKKQHPRTKGDATKTSNNFKKCSKRLNKLYYRIGCIREDWAHKVTTLLTNHYEYIAVETLNVQGLMKNHNLSRAISDIGFYNVKDKLKYKSAYKNRTLLEAGSFYPSSKTCSVCGHIKDKLSLSERIFTCEKCGNTIDRDLNAAINLRDHCLNKIGRAIPEFTPVELTALQESFIRNNLATSSIESGIR